MFSDYFHLALTDASGFYPITHSLTGHICHSTKYFKRVARCLEDFSYPFRYVLFVWINHKANTKIRMTYLPHAMLSLLASNTCVFSNHVL